MHDQTPLPSHFKGKDAKHHVLEKQAKGVMESHGMEMPGYLFAGADAIKEVSLTLLFLLTIADLFAFPLKQALIIAMLLSFGLIIGKACRSAYLAWSKLQRLHRIMRQERFEIQHHRAQEREELTAMYAMKGFEGKLLTQVIDVLMADDNRLLDVMLHEELGLTLQGYEHPLQPALGALVGALIGSVITLTLYLYLPFPWFASIDLLVMGLAAFFGAHKEDNPRLPALIWTMAIGALCTCIVYFTTFYFK